MIPSVLRRPHFLVVVLLVLTSHESGAAPASGSTQVPFISETMLGTMRNDFAGWVGMHFTVGNDSLVVTALGRIYVGGNTGLHRVKLVQSNSELDVPGGTVNVETSQGTDGPFIYAVLANPVILAPHQTYYLVSEEFEGGDRWHDLNTQVTSSDVAEIGGGVFSSTGLNYSTLGVPSNTYGPVNFKYAIGGGLFPPRVRLLNPPDNQEYLAPDAIGLEAEAQTSSDGVIQLVEFYLDATKLGEAASAPYLLTWTNPVGGVLDLRAVATDSFGRRGTSAPVTITITAPVELIQFGAEWSFWDTNGFPEAGWHTLAFAGASEKTGVAPFGYGYAGLTTSIDFGSDPTNKPITSYFRKVFNIEDATDFTYLQLDMVLDDGAIVFLNGTEIYRYHMPGGVVDPETRALTEVGTNALNDWVYLELPYGALITGSNVLAVELHQFAPDTPDLAFDLRLLGSGPVTTVLRGPYLQQGTASNIVVRWRTDLPVTGMVRFGTNANNLDRFVFYPFIRRDHAISLDGLEPDTKYYYSIGSAGFTYAAGPDYFFSTAPSTGKPTRIWVLGDSGTANADAMAVRNAYYQFTGARHTDLWLMLGDNAYPIGTDEQYQAAVFDMYPSMLRKSVLWPTIGNHDTVFSAQPPPTLPYFQIFTVPTAGEAGGVASGTEKYYSFNYGDIHFVCLDSMSSDRSPGGVMATWLEADLAAHDRPWLIAFFHHPPYTKGSHDSDRENDLAEMRQNLMPILEQHGVDLVLAGHSHCYERSMLLHGHFGLSTTLTPEMIRNPLSGRPDQGGAYYKAERGTEAGKGTVYVVAGSAGQATFGRLDHPAMYVSLLKLGSMVLGVDGPRLDATFLRDTGEIEDTFTILKTGDTIPGLRISAYHLEEGQMSLTFDSLPGESYSVVYSLDLVTWFVAVGAQVAPGPVATRNFPVLATGQSVFYRILNSTDD